MIKKIALVFALVFAPCTGFAGNVKPVVFLADSEVAKHKKTIVRVQDYLSGLTTITSEFIQVAPDGKLSSGKFFLERPGRMRWQYNPPTPILMVANGSDMGFYALYRRLSLFMEKWRIFLWNRC